MGAEQYHPQSGLTLDTHHLLVELEQRARAAGLPVHIGSTRRSCAEQGASIGPVKFGGIVLKRAAGCRSWHVWGRAFDISLGCELTDAACRAQYQRLGDMGKALGLEWGGDFATNYDPIHFQNPGEQTLAELCPDPSRCAEAVQAQAAVPGGAVRPVSAAAATVLGLAFGWTIARHGSQWLR